MYKTFRQLLIGNLIGIALVLVVATIATTAHCAVGKQRPNTLGFVAYETNPYIYLAGNLATEPGAVSEVDGNLNLRIKPTGTYMLYDESIMLCGMPTDKFEGVGDEFVLTYERVSHRTVQGVGCHALVRVDTVKVKEVQ